MRRPRSITTVFSFCCVAAISASALAISLPRMEATLVYGIPPHQNSVFWTERVCGGFRRYTHVRFARSRIVSPPPLCGATSSAALLARTTTTTTPTITTTEHSIASTSLFSNRLLLDDPQSMSLTALQFCGASPLSPSTSSFCHPQQAHPSRCEIACPGSAQPCPGTKSTLRDVALSSVPRMVSTGRKKALPLPAAKNAETLPICMAEGTGIRR